MKAMLPANWLQVARTGRSIPSHLPCLFVCRPVAQPTGFAAPHIRSHYHRVRCMASIASKPKPKVSVEVWSDLACPWCYLGCKRISRAIAEFGDAGDVEIEWRAFLLDPKFHAAHPEGEPLDDYLVAKFGPRALAMKQRVVDAGAADGVAFAAWNHRANTFPGHRLVALARQSGAAKTHETVKELFDRAYERGENISSAETVAAAGRAAGLSDADNWARSDEGALEVLRDDEQAKSMGITGVPAFLISSGTSRGSLLSGAQPPEVFVEVFQKVVAEGQGAKGSGGDTE